ncbi:MAG: nucleoside/nucleotide kinase family protein [Pseudonocardiales bacterium]|nr:nucleoside/nucleotide kinase family protein [Pseudonocardiales bacterium]
MRYRLSDRNAPYAAAVVESSWEELVAAAAALAAGPGRRLLGITGAPGSGKTVLAEAIVRAVGARARLVGMDGFHLPNAELARLGRLERKGAPDTFDAAGYVSLLQRLRPAVDLVCAPRFDRAAEEPVADAVSVPPDVRLVVTEGNYLLLDDGPWAEVAALLDARWYVEVPEPLRLERLVARHVDYGRSPPAARERAFGSDLRNARLVERTRARADRIVTVPSFDVDART